jgi:TP901 family phage tail tape measure protein
MADVQKTVEIIFGGKNELTGIIGNIESDFNRFDDAVRNVATPLAAAGDAVLKLDAALAALVIGGMALAIRESSEFNKSFALISTSVTASGSDLGKFRDDILDYSTHSVKSLQDINAALYTAAQAGVDWTNSLEFIGKAEQLAVANNANLNTTVDLLTGTMNAYGFTIQDVQHINDVFFTSTLIGKQTIDELGQSMGQVVGIAANSGVSFEALSAAIATMTAKGMDTANAITGMKGVITSIISPSNEAATAARALGLDFSLTELNARGFAGMMNEIMIKTGGSKEELVKLFPEVRAMNGAFMLTGDGMKFFNDALERTINSTGSAEAAYQKMVSTFSNQSQMLINTAKGVLIEVGTELEPMAARIAGSLGGVLTGVKIGLDQGAFDTVFAVFDQFSRDLSAAMSDIAGKFPEAFNNVDFSTLSEAIQNAGEVLTDALGSATTGDITAAIQDMVDSIASLISVTQGMGAVFAPVIDVIRWMITAFNNMDSGTKELTGSLMGMSMLYRLFGPLSLAIVALGADMEDTQYIFDIGSAAIENGINAIRVAVLSLALVFAEASLAAAELLDYIPGYDAQAGIDRTTERVRILSGMLNTAQTDLAVSSNRTRDAFAETGQYADNTEVRVSNYGRTINSIPADKSTAIIVDGSDSAMARVAAVNQSLGQIPATKSVGIEVQADGSTIDRAYGMIITRFPDGSVRIVQAQTTTNQSNLDDTKRKIDDAVPASKVMDIQASIDIAKIKEASAIVQKEIEWKAKLDIADVEANAKIIEAAFKSIDNTISSTGATLASITGSYATLMAAGGSGGNAVYDEMRAESRRRDAALLQQKDLIAAEVANLNARTALLDRGESLIKITADGLQPQLEAFMWEILKAIQIKANSEGANFLLGV